MMEQREILTIGYGGRGTIEFLELLTRYQIELLVDVRTVPYSGYYADFCKDALSRKLTDNGIAYQWLKALGGRPDDDDCFVGGKLNASRCEKRDWYQRGIARLKTLAREQRVAIMCSEKDPAHCHRSFVLGATLAKDASFAMLHIDKAGELKTQAALEGEIKPRQLDMQVLL